jgi:beta-glucosidase
MSDQVPTAFPPGFLWGAATAAYQIEGAAHEDGRGESVWDRFCATPGKVRNGDTGDVACDFYHRHAGDVALMRELGLGAFRFSVAWPRVLPEGRGPVNQSGLDFYDRLVDELLESGIEPFLTLFHWDTPQRLEDAGGWPSRATVEAFAEYAEVVAGRLGDRVRYWTTHNEPWVVSWLGHAKGEHAPGRRSEVDAVAAAHHLLLSHGRAVEVIRSLVPAARVGITLVVTPAYPASARPEDEAAAWQVDGEHNRWFLDPVFSGSYPADLAERNEIVAPFVLDGDMRTIAAPLDFLGVNNYTRHIVRAGEEGPLVLRAEGALTGMGWEVFPEGLHRSLCRIADDYAPRAIHVTENGAAYDDTRGHDGSVHDPERVAFLESHLSAVAQALSDGVPVEGYFVWSLLDNFEWARGYGKRFGLVYVDYPTLQRIPKDSFYWYRDFIARQRAVALRSSSAGAAGR